MDQRFLVFALVIVPVLSVCLGFTVHYAIRPLVEMLLDAIHDLGRITAGPSSDRVARIEAEVVELRAEVKLLRAGSEGRATAVEEATGSRGIPPGSV
ncbi:MAG: hypothetical protein HKN72_00525 [Gemmatimonadetes bacterium]|nr:hypothetical protein [Gemmatimonadota bacterium]NNL30529.1 hypothetical protein [Gemmatimonadota bacterium]